MRILKFSTVFLLTFLSSCLFYSIGYQQSFKTVRQVPVSLIIEPRMLNAVVDINPNALNLKGQGQWITAHIRLPEGYDTKDIDATTILLNGTISPVLDPKYGFIATSEHLSDNGDGTKCMVKFNRNEVASRIYNDLGLERGCVTLSVTGELYNGTQFEGRDSIKVLFPGSKDEHREFKL